MAPVDWMRGKLAGSQELLYDGAQGYDVPIGYEISAANYRACVVAKVMRLGYADRLRYFQVRTRSTVNMTATQHHNLALMGGAGALFAALMRQKTSAIYLACLAACPRKTPLRAFLFPLLRAGLDDKAANILISDGVTIVNPWISTSDPNVPVSAAVINKFNSELSNL